MMSKGKTRRLMKQQFGGPFSLLLRFYNRTHENRLLPVLKVHFQRTDHILSL